MKNPEKTAMDRLSYKVSGLDCAEETAALKKAIEPMPGIQSLDFDILNARMIATIDPAKIDSDAIVAAVASTGMKAALWSQKEPGQEPVSLWQLHGRLIMAGASASLLFLGFLVHWYMHGGLMDALLGGIERPYASSAIAIGHPFSWRDHRGGLVCHSEGFLFRKKDAARYEPADDGGSHWRRSHWGMV